MPRACPSGRPARIPLTRGTGTFVPHVMVRNLTGSPQSVTVTVEYPGEDGAEQTVSAPVAVAAYSTLNVSLDAVMGRLMVMQRHRGMASSYQCGWCPCSASYTGLTVSPSAFTSPRSATFRLAATADTSLSCALQV